jgi:FKBP-type peptidyl-prolyl cis-trans isomerase 2
MTVKKDKVVEMHYTLKNETGDVLNKRIKSPNVPFGINFS